MAGEKKASAGAGKAAPAAAKKTAAPSAAGKAKKSGQRSRSVLPKRFLKPSPRILPCTPLLDFVSKVTRPAISSQQRMLNNLAQMAIAAHMHVLYLNATPNKRCGVEHLVPSGQKLLYKATPAVTVPAQ